jgi:hypothetical protein
MATRYDAVTTRTDRDGKKRYTRIGAAFPSKEGDGFNIVLDALPMPNAEGQAWISLWVPKERDDRQPRSAPRSNGRRDDMDSDIPF